MTTSFSIGFILATGFVFITFAFIKYVLWQGDKDCKHEYQTTLDSYHKKVCIDCGAEFSTAEIEK